MINTQITMACLKCGIDTGATWKTLCYSCFKSRPIEEIRAYRQAKLDRKVIRLEAKAFRLDKTGEEKTATFRSFHGDISFFTQPNINSSSGRSFTKYRERVYSKYDAGIKLQVEAEETRKKAEWLKKQGAVVKGDAEKKRQAIRDYMDTQVKVGDTVYSWIVGECTIVKVNKKTYTVKNHRTSNVFTQDKSFIKKPNREEVNK